MRHSLFLTVVWGFIIGIFLRSVWPIAFSVQFWLLVLGAALASHALTSDLVFSVREIKQYSLYFLLCIFAASLSLGMMRYSLFVSYQGDPILAGKVGEKIALQ